MDVTLNIRDFTIGAVCACIMIFSYNMGTSIAKANLEFSGCPKGTKQAVWIKELKKPFKGELYLRCLK